MVCIESMMKLIDSHCHLDFDAFDGYRDSLVSDCVSQGMQALIVPGVSHQQWPDLSAWVEQQERVFAAFGLHPYFTSQHRLSQLDDLPPFLENGAVAVGEIGLDAFHGQQDIDLQYELFKAQLAIARDLRLPVIVHARKTQDLILKAVNELGFSEGGIMHAWSGSQQQAEKLVEKGFLIGFGGAATWDRANKLRRILQSLPLSALALETDSPDIPPCFARDETNTPLNLFRITEILAGFREMDANDFAMQTTQNVKQLFNLPTFG